MNCRVSSAPVVPHISCSHQHIRPANSPLTCPTLSAIFTQIRKSSASDPKYRIICSSFLSAGSSPGQDNLSKFSIFQIKTLTFQIFGSKLFNNNKMCAAQLRNEDSAQLRRGDCSVLTRIRS